MYICISQYLSFLLLYRLTGIATRCHRWGRLAHGIGQILLQTHIAVSIVRVQVSMSKAIHQLGALLNAACSGAFINDEDFWLFSQFDRFRYFKHLLYEPDSMSTGTPARAVLPTLAPPIAPPATFSGIFNGLERSTAAMIAPPADAPQPADVEGSVVVVVLVTPISTASASTWFKLELHEIKVRD